MADVQVRPPLDQRAVTRLRALFDECVLLLALERGRPGRSANDWYHQARRVADVIDGRDPYVTDTIMKLAALVEVRPKFASWEFDGLLKHVQAEREKRFVQMVGHLEADGTLPPVT